MGTIGFSGHDERPRPTGEDERIIKRLARLMGRCPKQTSQRLNLAAKDALKTNTGGIRVEEQLQGLNRKFRARIGQRTVALAQANGGLVSGKFPNQVGNAHRADIGELAASIAHDFNNILNVVEAYAALIASNPARPKDVVEHAEVIKETVEKGALLARQLVALGRKTETELESANINDLLHRMVKLLTPTFPTTIVIAEDLDPRVPMLMIDPGSTHQAILNLC